MGHFGIERQAEADRPHVWRIEVRGELDVATAPQLTEVVEQAIGHGASSVLLDLTAVEFLDSTGLRSIVQAANRFDELGGTLTCVGLSAAARTVLEVTGVLERLRGDEPDGDDP